MIPGAATDDKFNVQKNMNCSVVRQRTSIFSKCHSSRNPNRRRNKVKMNSENILAQLTDKDRQDLKDSYLKKARQQADSFDLEFFDEGDEDNDFEPRVLTPDYFQDKLQTQDLAISLDTQGNGYCVEISTMDKNEDYCPRAPFYLGQSIFAVIRDDFRREFRDFMMRSLLVEDLGPEQIAAQMEDEIGALYDPESIVTEMKERYEVMLSDGYDFFHPFTVRDKTAE